MPTRLSRGVEPTSKPFDSADSSTQPITFNHSLLLRFGLQPQLFEFLSFLDFEFDGLVTQQPLIVIFCIFLVLASQGDTEPQAVY